ncbi:MAG: hypothetical protein OXC44_06920 [Proteobacteria bacterium]|nr:hypothetical protein [Pseudomonadota bacterium]
MRIVWHIIIVYSLMILSGVIIWFLVWETAFANEAQKSSSSPDEDLSDIIARRKTSQKMGHFVDVSLGVLSGTYSLSYTGIEDDKDYLIEKTIPIYSLGFDYSYHLNLYRSLNYFVGTGVVLNASFLPNSDEVYIPWSYNVPSFIGGLALHLGTSHSIWIFGEYALRLLKNVTYTKKGISSSGNAPNTTSSKRTTVGFVAQDMKWVIKWAYYLDASMALVISGIWGKIVYKPYLLLKPKEAPSLNFTFQWPVIGSRLGIIYYF